MTNPDDMLAGVSVEARELLTVEQIAEIVHRTARTSVMTDRGVATVGLSGFESKRVAEAIEAALASSRAVALEEAAKLAEEHSNLQCGPYTREVCFTISAAIRALISEKPLPLAR